MSIKKRRFNAMGSTMLEVVLVILTLGVLALPVFRYFFGMTSSVQMSWVDTKAAQAGNTLLSEIRSTPFANIQTWNGYTGKVGDFNCTVTVQQVRRSGNELVDNTSGQWLLARVTMKLQKPGTTDRIITTLVPWK